MIFHTEILKKSKNKKFRIEWFWTWETHPHTKIHGSNSFRHVFHSLFDYFGHAYIAYLNILNPYPTLRWPTNSQINATLIIVVTFHMLTSQRVRLSWFPRLVNGSIKFHRIRTLPSFKNNAFGADVLPMVLTSEWKTFSKSKKNIFELFQNLL